VTALVVVALVVALAVLVALTVHAVSELSADPIDRPGSDDQWADLADAMRRYRRHKARGHSRA
jgi:wyosine [tRNA(Phe)-imidazoG37] synthetase (radical SAM superfamily)